MCFIIYIGLGLSGEKHVTEVDFLVIDLSGFGFKNLFFLMIR